MREIRCTCVGIALLALSLASTSACTVTPDDDGESTGAAGAPSANAGAAGAPSANAGAAGAPSANAGAAGMPTTACGDVTEDGACDGEVLSFCRNGMLETLDCAEVEMACTVSAGRADCTEPDRALACGNLTALGTCDGAMIRFCDETGAVSVARAINCAAYGQICDPTAAADGGALCVPYGSCDAVDENGVCSNNSLSFCEDDQLFIFDCGVDECREVSGFADCFVADIEDGCGSITVAGECVAGTLNRCLGNVVTREDCETLGLECVESSDGAACERGTECPAACPDRYTCGGGLCVPDDVPTPEWTIAVYMVGDNNLSDALWQDLNEIEWVGSDANLQVVAQTEFSSSWSVQTPLEYRSGTRRMFVEQDQDVTASTNLDDADDLGDLDMGASSTLSDFLRWTAENYPAKKMGLILSDHGLGYQGGFYDTTSGQLMDLREMVAGVRDSGVHLDLLGMDACMMGMHEVGMAFRGVADTMIASEEVEPGSGYPYHLVLAELREAPTMSAAEFGAVVVDNYVNGFTDPERERSVTMATIELGELPELNEQLASFAETVLREASGARSSIKGAVSSPGLMRSKTPSITDVGSILDVFSEITGAVGTSASDTRAWFDGSGAIPSARGTFAKEGTSGLAIYFPEAAWSSAGAGSYGNYWSGTSFLPLQPWYSLVGNLSSNEQEVATPGEGAVDWFTVVLSWGDAADSIVSNADLDLYVYEPSGDFGTPANGTTTVNGLLSSDSYDSEIPVESYELQAEHQTGAYLILASLYDIPTGERAFPRLQIYRNDLPGGSRTLLRGKIVDRELVEIPMDPSNLLTETITPENFEDVIDLDYSNIWYAVTIEVD